MSWHVKLVLKQKVIKSQKTHENPCSHEIPSYFLGQNNINKYSKLKTAEIVLLILLRFVCHHLFPLQAGNKGRNAETLSPARKYWGMWVHKTIWPLHFSITLFSADQEEFLLIQCTLGVWHLVTRCITLLWETIFNLEYAWLLVTTFMFWGNYTGTEEAVVKRKEVPIPALYIFTVIAIYI